MFFQVYIKMFVKIFYGCIKKARLFDIPSLLCFMHQRYETQSVAEMIFKHSKIYEKATAHAGMKT